MSKFIELSNLYSYSYTPTNTGAIEAYLFYKHSENNYHLVKTAIYPTIEDAEKDFKSYISYNAYSNC